MSKLFLITILLLALVLGGSGCKTETGNQQFVPGKGWVPSK
jgi:hypothetical protein